MSRGKSARSTKPSWRRPASHAACRRSRIGSKAKRVSEMEDWGTGVLDSYLRNVEQNECKKSYRAKHAKLAKAAPTPPFLLNYILASLAFFARDTSLFSCLFVVGKIQICLTRFRCSAYHSSHSRCTHQVGINEMQ